MSEIILPKSTIGILGGGQIGRLMALSAKKMGYKVGILDADPNCCAKNVADFFVESSFKNKEKLKEFAKKCDILTYDTLSVDVGKLRAIQNEMKMTQNLDLIQITQNRLLEKTFLDEKDMIIAPFKTINKAHEISEAIGEIGLPCVLKTIHTHKKHFIYSMKDAANAMRLLMDGSCILEAWIPAAHELSIQVVGNKKGEYTTFPVVEVIQRNKQIHEIIAPARIDEEARDEAKRIALEIAEALELVGALTIDMLQTKEGGIYIHQLTPRPSNTGHYSMNACNIDQFEAHLRGILSWSLPEITQLTPAVMINVLSEEYYETHHLLTEKPDWHFHYYDKEKVKRSRKMGHINILTDDVNQTIEEIYQTKIWD
ncbi:MAG: 5-(carboxyamino)imidazole ribonucleotide synthase [Streptococcaceae bacterium]|nr:5-(carboxyamino)imidazole ribonucleotide synthase [Streptococcaceae bacterium]